MTNQEMETRIKKLEKNITGILVILKRNAKIIENVNDQLKILGKLI